MGQDLTPSWEGRRGGLTVDGISEATLSFKCLSSEEFENVHLKFSFLT